MSETEETPTPEDYKFIQGLGEVADDYDAFILDIFGVLHNGVQAFPGTVGCLSELKKAGKLVCLLSNSPRRTESASQDMGEMGIERSFYTHIMTSGEATRKALKNPNSDLGRKCWLIGGKYVEDVVEGLDLEILAGPENADFILNAHPDYEEGNIQSLVTKLEVAVQSQLPMICSNPDTVVNIAGNLYECAGAFAELYEGLGDSVEYYGKPYAPVYEACYDLMGRPDKSRILAIGDSLDTDIAGGVSFGLDCALNVEGIHIDEISKADKPDEIDKSKLDAIVERVPNKPSYVLSKGFRWA